MKIGLLDVKQALLDSRFRESLPDNMKESVAKFLHNPGCSCNVPIYKKIIKECTEQLKKYFPGKEILNEEENLAKNFWVVINCNINELESKLKSLSDGRKQIAIARYEDQATVIVNELDFF